MHLGLDLSTQSCSAMLIEPASGKIIYEGTVSFGGDLPEYGCPNGFIPDGKDGEVHAPPLMWVDALDLLFSRMKDEGVDFSAVRGISGSGQQHGSVYLNAAFNSKVSALDASLSLKENLEETFSRNSSPIWMDTSTTSECREMAETIGGDDIMCGKTGSIAIERFTGAQIRKFFKEDPEAYENTETIHLVSSFFCSLLAGTSAPIDLGDGAGMNLLNLKAQDWDAEILEATALGLKEKLPPASSSTAVIGTISSYFSEKYGFSPTCQIMAWSGDNPCSLVGMGASTPGTAVISLGTSDTFFAAMPDALTDPNGYGHVFGNPMGGFMSLICFLNGSLAREAVKERFSLDWDAFDKEGLAETLPGNNGLLMLPFFNNEITPRLDSDGPLHSENWSEEDKADSTKTVRATLEGQFLNMRIQSEWMGVTLDEIRVTGGASQSDGICQIISNVFGCPLSRLETTGSAALGAALKSATADGHALSDLEKRFCQTSGTITPEPAAVEIYNQQISAFKALLEQAQTM